MTPQTEMSWRGKVDVAGVSGVGGASLAIKNINDFFPLEILRSSPTTDPPSEKARAAAMSRERRSRKAEKTMSPDETWERKANTEKEEKRRENTKMQADR